MKRPEKHSGISEMILLLIRWQIKNTAEIQVKQSKKY